MKYLITLLFTLIAFAGWSQIKGDKNIVTRSFPINNLRVLEVNLYADVQIDCSEQELLTITADKNLFDLIEKSVEDGQLKLTQKEWIKPSQQIKITIGAPQLERIQQSVHETTVVKNINRSTFNAMAIIGTLVLDGKVETLFASGEIGKVDARNLEAPVVDVNLWSRGKIQLGTPQKITGIVKDNGEVLYSGTPDVLKIKMESEGKVQSGEKVTVNSEIRFIKFKVKNNSFNRINCYVKGPKSDGSYFSYGFPMNPGQVRKKDWTIGSKVYRETKLGTRKLLVKIKASDEGEVVDLYINK
jgi:hypothetical protein